MDLYSACTCGSGKKFKWCCQPIHEETSRVFALMEQGQAEAAARAMEEVTQRHPTNPQVWGQKAQLQHALGLAEEAEKSLDQAFALFPTYPFGFYLKAHFRLQEGEIGGGLLLLRKASESYDPNASEMLAQVYLDIFDCEIKLNHPVAARAALELALRLQPANEDLRKGLQSIFESDNPNLPASARKAYHFKAPSSATPERRAAWENMLKTPGASKLSEAVPRFAALTEADPGDAPGWYNLALCHAWLGNNAKAVAALDQYVTLEGDETLASQAWALAEVLRHGHGMEDYADVVTHSVTFGLRDPQAFVNVLGEMEQSGRMAGTRVDEEQGVLSAVILETTPPALTPELQAKQLVRPAAYLVMMNNAVRLWNTDRALLDDAFGLFQQKLGANLAQHQFSRGAAKYSDILSEATRIPRGTVNQEETIKRLSEAVERYFEETWAQRRLKSLDGATPLDAATKPSLRKKLRGVVQFLRECAEMVKFPYDFTRLAGKLGLTDAPAAATSTSAGAKPDIASLSAADLSALDITALSAAELDQAYQAALKLEARDLAGKFAGQLVERPAYAERPDRFPLFQLLVNQSMAQGNLDDALDYLNDGERDDCENNQGGRRNEYELRRAQVHSKRGEYDQAQDVYDRLIARAPTDLNYRVNAAETMLSARQGSRAQKYAKEGLDAALKQNNRDLEGHFRELAEAAQRQ